MKKSIETFKSSNGSDSITYYVYPPDTEPRGVLQVSHGMCEYLERYENLAEFLGQAGFVVCGNDHLGHGRTCPPERLGYFATEDGWKYLVEDLYKLTGRIKQRYAGIPYFMLGHSMGSFILRQYLTQYSEGLSGAILCGTSGGLPIIKEGIMLAEYLKRTRGEFYRSKKLTTMVFGAYNRKYAEHNSDFDWLSRDEKVVQRYEKDANCNFIFTASGYKDLFLLLSEVSKKEWPYLLPKSLPILVMSGDMDPVGEFGEGVKKVYQSLQEAQITDLTLQLYSQARHELLNDSCAQEVMQDILHWMEKRL